MTPDRCYTNSRRAERLPANGTSPDRPRDTSFDPDSPSSALADPPLAGDFRSSRYALLAQAQQMGSVKNLSHI